MTSIRGLAAVWVVLFHFQNDLYLLLPGSLALAPVLTRGSLAVPMFFILSGYVLAFNYFDSFAMLSVRHYGRFLSRRWLRVYPLHLVTLMSVAVMVSAARPLGASLTDEGYSTATFVQNLFLVQAWVPEFRLNWNYPSWSISSEWFAYLLFPLLCVVLHRMRSTARLRIVAVGACLGMLAYYSLSLSERLPFGEMLVVIFPFVLGVCGFVLQRDHRLPRNVLMWTCRLSFIAVVAVPYLTRRHATLILLLLALSGIVLSLGSLGHRGPAWLKACPLIALGKASYALYMTHALAQKVLYTLLPAERFAQSSVLIRCLVVAGYGFAIGGVAWLGYAAIDTKFRAWWGRRLNVRQAPSVPQQTIAH